MALVLSGTVVPVADHLPDQFAGRVYIGDDGLIDAVKASGTRAPAGYADAPVVETDGSIYPGLIDLHSHTAYNTLPLWTEPGRVDPWAHHNSWTSAGSYHEKVVWPTGVLGYAAGPALLAFIGLKALIGGTTSIQGSVSKPKLRFPWVVRVVENEAIGSRKDPIRAATLTTTDPAKLKPYVTGMTAGAGLHLPLRRRTAGHRGDQGVRRGRHRARPSFRAHRRPLHRARRNRTSSAGPPRPARSCGRRSPTSGCTA